MSLQAFYGESVCCGASWFGGQAVFCEENLCYGDTLCYGFSLFLLGESTLFEQCLCMMGQICVLLGWSVSWSISVCCGSLYLSVWVFQLSHELYSGGNLCLLDSLCALVGVCVVGQVCVTWGEAVCPGEGLCAPGSVFMPGDESSTLAGVCLCAVGWSLCALVRVHVI